MTTVNPYESPPETDETRYAARSADKRFVYKPVAELLRWNRNLAIATLIGAALLHLSNLLVFTFALELGADDPASVFSLSVNCIGLLQIALDLAWNICFAMATYRVAANAHALADDPPHYAPSYAVGSYFIPFLNLVRPYQAMKQCYESCSLAASWALLRWWTLHLLSGLLQMVAGYCWNAVDGERLEIQAMHLANAATIAGLITLPFGILLAIFSHSVLARLARKQAEMTLTNYVGEGPPPLVDPLVG